MRCCICDFKLRSALHTNSYSTDSMTVSMEFSVFELANPDMLTIGSFSEHIVSGRIDVSCTCGGSGRVSTAESAKLTSSLTDGSSASLAVSMLNFMLTVASICLPSNCNDKFISQLICTLWFANNGNNCNVTYD